MVQSARVCKGTSHSDGMVGEDFRETVVFDQDLLTEKEELSSMRGLERRMFRLWKQQVQLLERDKTMVLRVQEKYVHVTCRSFRWER